MPVKPVPDGFHTVTPYLIVSNASKLIDFLKRAFDAKEIERLATPDGTIMHTQVKIGDSIVMLSDPRGDCKAAAPSALYVYVLDVDATYRRAMAAGAISIREPVDMFYGDRSGGVKDPSGNTWWIATHIEDLPFPEIERRAAEMMSPKR